MSLVYIVGGVAVFFIYYETSVITLFGKNSIRYLKWFYLLPGVIFAGVNHVNELWVFANISVGVCALPNLIALLALNGAFFKLMKDFLENRNRYAVFKVDSNRDYVVKARRSQQKA